MKIISIITALTISMFTASAFAQDFSKFESQKGVTSVVFTKQMFKLMSQLDLESEDEEMQSYIKLIENLDDIKVFISQTSTSKLDLKTEVDKYLDSASLDLLMRVNEDNNKVLFYVKPGQTEELVNQLFMYVESNDEDDFKSVVMMINGEVDLKEISKLTKKLNVPGAESLENLNDEK